MTKDQLKEKQELIKWIEEHDKFELLYGEIKRLPLAKLRRVKVIVSNIHQAVDRFVKEIRNISVKGGSSLGMGDTATD